MADEKKRIIDLAELSQEVQEGQYILVDSAGGTGKMGLKKIVDDSVEDLANEGGYYPDLYAGNLISDRKYIDSVPYLFRKTAGGASKIGERENDTLVGATARMNQLVDADTSSVTIQSGHKYYANISGAESIGASTGEAISVTGGSDMVTDLTAYFGSASIADYIYSLETATAGAGVAKLKEWGFLTEGYYEHNPESLESVQATAHKMTGFNQWNEEWEVGGINSSTGENDNATACIRSKNYIPVIPSTNYYFCCSGWGNTTNVRTRFYDANKNYIGYKQKNENDVTKNAVFTTPDNCYFMRFVPPDAYGTTYNSDICINLSNPNKNGTYEPYVSHTYDLGTDTLRGLFKLDSENNLYADGDTKTSDGTVTRKYGTRAYQSGDESLADAITDGTTTVYKLTTPTTEQSTPFTNPQICDPNGTEEYVTSNGIPVGHVTEYDYDIKGLAEELIDVPDVPSTNGTYVLKATRTVDGLTYSWVTG